ncbi:FAD-dependent oxidoreductase [Longimycelium tulufanense]|uniref:FAD-dependent oxidoreductase n=1 Tax=Longimycelium tulufanense TaxID=907463 RepID=A0A8J3CB04_9PSEU|nr:FAD-dependent monooxygenase [Longimycelium tulufanense]GGM41227.1 FAD-dependent oxidoreductase [Longimycelium tulufanense]
MTHALIIGGGIAGPATAMALAKAGMDATIYEAYPTGADDIGAFLSIMANGLDALRAIEAEQPVVDNSFAGDSVISCNASGARLDERSLVKETAVGPRGPRTLTRAGLYRVLHTEAGRRGITIEHGKRLTDAVVGSNGRVVASFADGSQAEGDLLIGADGIHSATRAIIDPEAPRPRYTGVNVAYGYTDERWVASATNSYHMIYGNRAFFGYTTAPDGQTWWFARIQGEELSKNDIAVTPSAQWRQWTLGFFTEDGTPAADIVRATGENIFVNSTYDIPSTPTWYTPSMVLVGDAAHAASPAAGQGASMALEDSVVLAKCLRDIPDRAQAFATYEKLRRGRVERLVAASAEQAATATRDGVKRILSDVGQRTKQGKPSEKRSWLYDHQIDWDTPVTPEP